MMKNDMNRRTFLKTSGGAAAGVAAATTGAVSMGFSVNAWAAELKALSAHQGKTLLAVARQMFPHPGLADMYYASVVNDLDAEASADAEAAKVLEDGVAKLDAATKVSWRSLSDGYQLQTLKAMEKSAFFQKVKGKAVVSLYNNPLVWRELGYEGPSAQLGGYINRGFDDLYWLDAPAADASPKVG